MSGYTYRLLCEFCSWRKITDGSDIGDLVEFKKSKIQRGIPRLDPKTQTIKEPEWKSLKKMWKCPNCGRLVKAVRIQDAQKKLEEKIEKKKQEVEQEESKKILIEEMKESYKERKEKEAEKAKQDAENRAISREIEEIRLKEEKTKTFSIEDKDERDEREN